MRLALSRYQTQEDITRKKAIKQKISHADRCKTFKSNFSKSNPTMYKRDNTSGPKNAGLTLKKKSINLIHHIKKLKRQKPHYHLNRYRKKVQDTIQIQCGKMLLIN